MEMNRRIFNTSLLIDDFLILPRLKMSMKKVQLCESEGTSELSTIYICHGVQGNAQHNAPWKNSNQ